MNFSFLGFRGLEEVFNIHPVFVHFPIVLFPLCLLLYLLSLKIKGDGFRLAAQLTLVLAAFISAPYPIYSTLIPQTRVFSHPSTNVPSLRAC